jgi:hypothetical protein
MLAVLGAAKIAELAHGSRSGSSLLNITQLPDSSEQKSFSSQLETSEFASSTAVRRSAPKRAVRPAKQI